MQYFYNSLAVFCVVVAYKWAINTSYVSRMRNYIREHREYMVKAIQSRGEWDFPKKTSEIKALVLKSGISDQYISWGEQIGGGLVQRQKMSVLDNMTFVNKEVQGKVIDILRRAEGVFETRRREAFNPLYWTEIILHLPAHIFQYVGVPDGSVWLRVANVVAWIVAVPSFLLSLPDSADWQKAVSHAFVTATSYFK